MNLTSLTPDQIDALSKGAVLLVGALITGLVSLINAFWTWKTRVELDRFAGAQRGGIEHERQRSVIAETVFPRRNQNATPTPSQVSDPNPVGISDQSDIPGGGGTAGEVSEERAL
jgi:hypothetical protein